MHIILILRIFLSSFLTTSCWLLFNLYTETKILLQTKMEDQRWSLEKYQMKNSYNKKYFNWMKKKIMMKLFHFGYTFILIGWKYIFILCKYILLNTSLFWLNKNIFWHHIKILFATFQQPYSTRKTNLNAHALLVVPFATTAAVCHKISITRFHIIMKVGFRYNIHKKTEEQIYNDKIVYWSYCLLASK